MPAGRGGDGETKFVLGKESGGGFASAERNGIVFRHAPSLHGDFHPNRSTVGGEVSDISVFKPEDLKVALHLFRGKPASVAVRGVFCQVVIGGLVKALGKLVVATPKEWVDGVFDHGNGISSDHGENLDCVLVDFAILNVQFGLQGIDARWVLAQIPRSQVNEAWLVAACQKAQAC